MQREKLEVMLDKTKQMDIISSRVVYRGYIIASTLGGVSMSHANYDSSATSTSLGSRLAFRGRLVMLIISTTS